MKLILEKENGEKIEVAEIETLTGNEEMLFFFLTSRLRPQDIEKIEKKLSNKTGKECIILDRLFATKIMGI